MRRDSIYTRTRLQGCCNRRSASSHRLWMISIALFLMPALFYGQALASGKSVYGFHDEESYGRYTVRIFLYHQDTDEGYFEILRNGKALYRKKGHNFNVGHILDGVREKREDQDAASDEPPINADLIAMGRDITGRGVPNLVISEWSGGAHCCYYYHVFEIGKRFRKIATIDAAHGENSVFREVEGEKGLVFATWDFAFAYWNASFAASPAPQVYLRYKNGKYGFARELMVKPAPIPSFLSDAIARIRSDEAWKKDGPPVLLWETMLDLIYSGNARAARDLFHEAWPPAIQGKDKFLKEFRKQLSESVYWKEVKKLNKMK